MEHACFIAHGVPARVKMRADKVVELCRLHGLYAQGAFDWQTTMTSLAWLNRLRVRLATNPNPHDYAEHGPDSMWEANHCDCEVCEPDNPFQACVPDDPNPTPVITPDDMRRAAWGRRNLDPDPSQTLTSPLIMIM